MVYRVKESFSFDDQGVPTTLKVGTLLDANDPRVQGHEAFLERAETAAARTTTAVETTTAAPGQSRQMSELDRLRAEAAQLGVEVDGRWSAKRLQQEIDKAKSQ